jgi:2,4-dienoyl-CoA reductase-like NADH-dependent reductase (Old Yellow Enzyme family)/thioredoxin reductase
VKFDKLFEPTRIGTMRLKNRIVFPPIHSTFVSETGAVTDQLIDYLVERARGGVSMITVEDTVVDYPGGKDAPTQLRLDSDEFIYGLGDMVEAIHEHGVKVATNPQHAGRQTDLSNTNGVQLVAPSSIPLPGYPIPRALSIEEIQGIEDKFADAVLRSKRVGFDAVELHAAHGYLFTQFFSPRTNRRDDLYGGSLENRARFSIEVVEKVREKVGNSFPVIYRFSAEENVEGGFTIEDSKRLVRWLEDAGVDAFHVSTGTYESQCWNVPCYDMPRGLLVNLAGEIRKTVSVPVITVGRLDPETAVKALEDGKADIAAIGRPLIADPEWPKKVREGRLEDIRPCIYCNQGCIGRDFNFRRESCTVNFEHGKERRTRIAPAGRPRGIVIVGGGPAGMEAARVAALRGHKVTLFERRRELGGQLIAASVPFFKEEYRRLLQYFKTQLKKLGVRTELGKEVDANTVRELRPDVVIMATGGMPYVPAIPGVSLPNVVGAEELILGSKNVAENVIIAGGGFLGCDVAWFLAAKGKKVTIVSKREDVAATLNPVCRSRLLKVFDELGVKKIPNSAVTNICEKTVTVTDRNFSSKTIDVDNVVIAMGYKSNRTLSEGLRGVSKEFHRIGDCEKVQSLREAIHAGSSIARKI